MPDFRPIRIKQAGVAPDWPCLPMIPGDWREVPLPLIAVLLSQSARTEATGAHPLPSPIERMRALRLSFYPGWLLLEGLTRYAADADGVFRLLLGPEGYELLNGLSLMIHDLNPKHLVLSGEAAQIDQYLRFFTYAVRGDDGPFRIVEGIGDIEPDRTITPSARQLAPELLRPLRRCRARKEGFIRKAVILYGRNLFAATFCIPRGGKVMMLSDKLVCEGFVTTGMTLDGIWQVFPERPASPAPKATRDDV